MTNDSVAKLGRSSREPARGSAHESAVDRLIELASDPKPAASPAAKAGRMLALEQPKDSGQNSMWKTLLQLKSVLPYVSRFLPLLDMISGGQGFGQGMSREMQENVAGIQTGQRELRIAVQDQSLHVRRLEEQMVALKEASEKNATEQAEMVKSLSSLVRAVGAGLAILLVILILMVGALLAHVVR